MARRAAGGCGSAGCGRPGARRAVVQHPGVHGGRRVLVTRQRPVCRMGGDERRAADQLTSTARCAPLPEALRRPMAEAAAALCAAGWLGDFSQADATLVAPEHLLELASPPHSRHTTVMLLGAMPEGAGDCPPNSLDPGDMFVLSGTPPGKRKVSCASPSRKRRAPWAWRSRREQRDNARPAPTRRPGSEVADAVATTPARREQRDNARPAPTRRPSSEAADTGGM